jgi:hypothetical protein
MLRGGRWRYNFLEDPSEHIDDMREFWFDYATGTATVPSGCTPVTSGEKVKMSYTWRDEQEYFYPDDEIWLFVKDAADEVDAMGISHGCVLSGDGYEDAVITGSLVGTDGLVVMLQAALTILEKDQRQHLTSAVVIREADMSYDNTRGVTLRISTIAELRNKIREMLKGALIADQHGGMGRIDVYSTRDFGTTMIGEYHECTDGEDSVGGTYEG